MTDTLLDPYDTGEITPLGELEETQNLAPKIIAALTRISPNLRSADATDVIPVFEEPILVNPARNATLADHLFGYDQGGYPPVPPPIPPQPAPGKYRSPERARFKPGRVGRRGRHAAPPPAWTRWAVWIGVTLFALSAPSVAVLAVIR